VLCYKIYLELSLKDLLKFASLRLMIMRLQLKKPKFVWRRGEGGGREGRGRGERERGEGRGGSRRGKNKQKVVGEE
jgi:hypothetical protein